MEYDLEERTIKFSEDLIKLCGIVKITLTNENIVKQLLRSGTSVGANYNEANGATSKTDFKSKIHICKKEAKETIYWLRLLAGVVDEGIKNKIRVLWQEGKELTLIFSKIASSSKI
ncbi:MAG: four helix bundle protein [Candidatus Shapirobacteria bacterium]|jgi:four helix bundle protein